MEVVINGGKRRRVSSQIGREIKCLETWYAIWHFSQGHEMVQQVINPTNNVQCQICKSMHIPGGGVCTVQCSKSYANQRKSSCSTPVPTSLISLSPIIVADTSSSRQISIKLWDSRNRQVVVTGGFALVFGGFPFEVSVFGNLGAGLPALALLFSGVFLTLRLQDHRALTPSSPVL